MPHRTTLAAYRAAFGTLTLVAVGVQLVAASSKPEFALANFFGYFTILSNTFAALVFVYAATKNGTPSHGRDVLRGAATLCMAVVGVVFSLLLAGLESNVIPWVNVVVHYVMPAAVVADWIFDPPHAPLALRDAVVWLAIPLAYITYTMVRGSFAHWYPYPFLDVEKIGTAVVATYVIAIFVVTAILAACVLKGGNALRTRREVPLRPPA